MKDKTRSIAVIGASGAIGMAFVEHLSISYPNANIHAFSRREPKNIPPNTFYHRIDYHDEASIENSSRIASENASLDKVIIATGILHDGDLMPEKSLRDLSAEKFLLLFKINTIVPALITKHFLPKLTRERRSVFAILSARVGSISDNHLGGWYAYRASKAALNMVIKNASIEIGRANRQAIIVGLHPGTVDSSLSGPFQKNVPEGKLFTPEYSSQKLLQVLEELTPEQSGKCFAWNGKEIVP